MLNKLKNKYSYSLILLRELVITEFKLRYQGSFLGYIWSLLKPLFLFIILYFVFVYFLKIGSDIPHWPVAMLLGIVLWNFFSEITNNGLGSIVGRGDVIRKINFPKYVIVIAASISALINLALNLLVVSLFMLLNGADISMFAFLAPLYILEILLFSLGLAFLLSAVYVWVRDINYIWEIIMQALFYASAIIYPLVMIVDRGHKELAILIAMSPVTHAIQEIRFLLTSEKNLTLAQLVDGNILLSAIPWLITIGTFVIGAYIFKKRSPYFAENV